jgi:hypothetical protein
MGHRVNFSATPVSRLQLWHYYWLVSVQSGNDLHSRLPLVLHFLSNEEAISVKETSQRLDDVQVKVACIFFLLGTVGLERT